MQCKLFARHRHVERRQRHVNLLAVVIHAVETAAHLGIAIRDMVAVVGKLLAGREARRFADDFVAFDDQAAAVAVDHDPFAAQEPDGAIGFVFDRDEINEGVRVIRWQAGATVVINQLVELCGEAGQFYGFARQGKKRTQFSPGRNLIRPCRQRPGHLDNWYLAVGNSD